MAPSKICARLVHKRLVHMSLIIAVRLSGSPERKPSRLKPDSMDSQVEYVPPPNNLVLLEAARRSRKQSTEK